MVVSCVYIYTSLQSVRAKEERQSSLPLFLGHMAAHEYVCTQSGIGTSLKLSRELEVLVGFFLS
jgi:hypothetical protein